MAAERINRRRDLGLREERMGEKERGMPRASQSSSYQPARHRVRHTELKKKGKNLARWWWRMP